MAATEYATIPDLISVLSCAYNDDLTKMVACNSEGRVQICEKSVQQLWQTTTDLPVTSSAATTQVAWAHSEHGSVVACASENGLVTIWQQAATINGQKQQWTLRASFTDSTQAITCLRFAPAPLGPQLAAASNDGFVRFYEASAALTASTWQLRNDLQTSSSGGCKCLSWRQHTPALPPMLCLGTSEGASVWYYRSTLGDWVQAAALDAGNPVTSIDWAPALGRPVELIAAATSSGVRIWSLQGKVHDLQVSQMQCHSADGETGIDTLSVERQAWKVQFDRMGALLATSAVDGDSSNVCVWELNPQGQWYLLSRIVGEPQETSAGTMLE